MDFINGDLQYENYIKLTYNAVDDESVFQKFKSNQNYIGILEHVSFEQGLEYLDEINKYLKLPESLWLNFLENDKIGNPNRYLYDLPIGRYYVSPTTLRYIKFSLDVYYTKISNKQNLDIVEIGGGYGGFCKIFLDLMEYFGITIDSYTILDLDGPAKLAKKYLDIVKHGKCGKIQTGTIDKLSLDKIELVLAFYSYSEISLEFRKIYIDKVINKSNSGFFCWNLNLTNEDIKNELSKNISVFHEIPLTGPYNRIIMY